MFYNAEIAPTCRYKEQEQNATKCKIPPSVTMIPRLNKFLRITVSQSFVLLEALIRNTAEFTTEKITDKYSQRIDITASINILLLGEKFRRSIPRCAAKVSVYIKSIIVGKTEIYQFHIVISPGDKDIFRLYIIVNDIGMMNVSNSG